ncbi:hypothetical protein [Streptomyces stelliscabiei]|uniref:hypothetical protein n=1 Tax=Streptomyces stelliscabiei TaxID=146820 RepID=UPI002FF13464
MCGAGSRRIDRTTDFRTTDFRTTDLRTTDLRTTDLRTTDRAAAPTARRAVGKSPSRARE